MNSKRIVLLLFTLFLPLSNAGHAGNTKMMELQGKHLIRLNEQALAQVPNLPKDGRVILDANIVRRGGRTEILIESISMSSTKVEVDPPLEAVRGYRTDLLSVPNRNSAEDDTDGSRALEAAVLETLRGPLGSQESFRTRRLTENEMASLAWPEGKRPRVAVVLYLP